MPYVHANVPFPSSPKHCEVIGPISYQIRANGSITKISFQVRRKVMMWKTIFILWIGGLTLFLMIFISITDRLKD